MLDVKLLKMAGIEAFLAELFARADFPKPTGGINVRIDLSGRPQPYLEVGPYVIVFDENYDYSGLAQRNHVVVGWLQTLVVTLTPYLHLNSDGTVRGRIVSFSHGPGTGNYAGVHAYEVAPHKS